MKYHHGNLKETLIESAFSVCECEGYEQMSLRSIAKNANVSQTAPYRHFKTKQDLLAEVAKRGFVELKGILLNASDNKKIAENPQERFLDMGLAYLNFGLEKPNIYDLMNGPECPKNDYPELKAEAQETFAILIAAIVELKPGINETELKMMSIKHWATLHGLVDLLRNKDIAESKWGAGPALSAVKKDLRKFLRLSLN